MLTNYDTSVKTNDNRISIKLMSETLGNGGTKLQHETDNWLELAGGLQAIQQNTKPLPEDIPAINGALSSLLGKLLNVNGNLAAIVDVANNKK